LRLRAALNREQTVFICFTSTTIQVLTLRARFFFLKRLRDALNREQTLRSELQQELYAYKRASAIGGWEKGGGGVT
jgi:hypothetical protein